ncbi:hypothetical protein GCM10022258_23420 [Aquimarina gracilis]
MFIASCFLQNSQEHLRITTQKLTLPSQNLERRDDAMGFFNLLEGRFNLLKGHFNEVLDFDRLCIENILLKF